MNLKTRTTILGAVIAAALSATAFADGLVQDGNRYFDLPRAYQSEISVSDAYLAMEHSKDFSNKSKQPKPVLIDVRSLREYASGHPEDAYNVPYPTVSGMGGDALQDPLKLYQEVYRIVKGNLDTPIMTLCRTGHRSVLAGNILADPEHYGLEGMGLQPFTNVRNIWEGFVGQPKYAFKTGSNQLQIDVETDPVTGDETIVTYQLDLNNDGAINSDAADVYTQTKDANPDKDGWRNFAGLPWSTHIQKPLAYERDTGLYQALNLTPVQ
jgi:rhodanese-related sulfurtransferase